MNEEIEVIRGSGNVFKDLGLPNPDLEQLRTILAARIIGVMNARGETARKLAKEIDIDEADLARIRKAKLGRFTVDRLMTILDKLDQSVEINVTVTPRSSGPATAPQPALF